MEADIRYFILDVFREDGSRVSSYWQHLSLYLVSVPVVEVDSCTFYQDKISPDVIPPPKDAGQLRPPLLPRLTPLMVESCDDRVVPPGTAWAFLIK